LRVRGCDRDCKSCALLELCGGIKQYNVEGYRCFEAGCELGFPAIKRMQECSTCSIGKLNWNLKDEEVAGLVNEIAHLSKVKSQPVELPSVVPIVSLNDSSSYYFDPLKIDAIVVTFEDLLDENIHREVEKAGDIHSYLNYEGKVLISSILPDDLITQEAFFYFFLEIVDRLKFDAAIAWDSPVYVDIPLYDSWVNLLMGLKLTHELADWGLPVLGLAKGNVENQIRFSVETLARVGINSMALHASEYMMVRKEDSTVMQILYTYSGYLSKLAQSVLLVGVLNPKWLSFFENSFPKGPRLSYAGMSWLLDANRGLLYTNTEYADATSQYVRCECPTCSKTAPLELMAHPGLRAKHNLSYLINRLSDPSYVAPKLSTLDLILKEDEKVLIVSDLHMWTGRALLDNFVDFLGEEKPTYIIFLGDIFHFQGRPDLAEARGFFYALEDLGSLIFVAKGCSDGDDEKFLSAYDKLAINARPRPRLWSATAKQEEETDEVQTCMDLYRFYRCAREELRIRLADGRVIVAKHGHDIVEGMASEPVETIAKELEEARARAHANWLIVGHLHRAFVDGERRVASTGCWAIGEPYADRLTRKEDLMTAIIVHGDGRVELKRRC
jgi:predicted phosphodiesterase